MNIEKEIDDSTLDSVLRCVLMGVYGLVNTQAEQSVSSRVETHIRHELWANTVVIMSKIEERFIEAYEY